VTVCTIGWHPDILSLASKGYRYAVLVHSTLVGKTRCCRSELGQVHSYLQTHSRALKVRNLQLPHLVWCEAHLSQNSTDRTLRKIATIRPRDCSYHPEENRDVSARSYYLTVDIFTDRVHTLGRGFSEALVL
jgi:hypothetical protein